MRINLNFLRYLSNSGLVPSWLLIGGAVIIGGPFLLVSAFTLLVAFLSLSEGSWEEAAVAAGVGVVTGGVGAFIIRMAWRGRKQKKRAEAHADEPWMVREEWTDGHIPSEGSSTLWKSGLVALVWNVVAWGFIWLQSDQLLQEGLTLGPHLIVWVFPAIGLWLVGRWGYKVLRRLKYGESVFKMTTLPGEIGGAVRGSVETGMEAEEAPEQGFAVKLGCYRREVYYRRDSDGDRKRKVRLNEVWSTTQTVQPQPRADGNVVVPIDFHVPPGMDASTPHRRKERLLWRLDVEADVPGIDYGAQFEIPVFEPETASSTSSEELAEGEHEAFSADGDGATAEEPASVQRAAPAGASSGSRDSTESPERTRDKAPWTYREAWSEGHIAADKDTGSLIFLSLFALVWNGFSWPMAWWVLFGGGTSSGEGNPYMVLIFPLIGLVVAAIAIYKAIHRRKYGDTSFEMDEVPGVLGGTISGTVTTGMQASDAPEDGFKVMLSCFRRRVTTDSDGDRDVDLDLYWRDEKRVRPQSSTAEGAAKVPVFFEVPDDQPESTPVKKSNRILWRLDVEADVPGVDYAAQMEVPVFEVPERTRSAEAEQEQESDTVFWEMGEEEQEADALRREEAASAENPYAEHEIEEHFTEPVSKGIEMERTPGGGLRFYFGAARQKGAALMLTILTIATGVAAVFAFASGSLLGGLVVGIFPLVCGYFAYRYWTYASSVLIQNGQIAVKEGPFGTGTPTAFPCAELEEVKVETGGRSMNNASYELHLVRSGDQDQVEQNTAKAAAFMEDMGVDVDESAQRSMNRAHKRGQHLVAARRLNNHAEADWIAAQIEEHAAEEARYA